MSQRSSLSVVLSEVDIARDPSTGALAPAAFRRAVDAWTGAAKRSSCLLLLRIDRPADAPPMSRGDRIEALRTVTEVVAPCVRNSDVLGRVDGETIGVLLPSTAEHLAEQVSRRLRAMVSTRASVAGHGLTVSVGASSARGIEAWRNAAQALCEAQALGGDHTIVAGSAPADALRQAA